MVPPKIGFATSAKYRDLTAGDLLAVAELRRRGHQVEPLVWSETPPDGVAFDAVILRSVWDYHLYPERFLDWVTTVATRALVLNPPDIVRWNADKRYMFDLQHAGIPVPKTALLPAGCKPDLSAVLQDGSKAVIKPVISASAYETYWIELDNAATVQPRITELLRSRDMLIQEFVPEILSRGEWSLMFFDAVYSHAVRKVPQSGDFRVQSEFGGIHTPENPPPAVLDLAQRTVDRFASNTLYARIDLVETTPEALMMEVELIDPELFLATGSDTAVQFVDALLRKWKASSKGIEAR